MVLVAGLGFAVEMAGGAACDPASAVKFGGTCSTEACADALKVQLERDDWGGGPVEVFLELDGETVQCSVPELPAPCGVASCPEGAGVRLEFEGCPTSDEASSTGTDGSTTGASTGGGATTSEARSDRIRAVVVEQGRSPDRVRIEIVQDGSSLGSLTLTPEYERSQPNGPGCLPLCETAPDDTLDLP